MGHSGDGGGGNDEELFFSGHGLKPEVRFGYRVVLRVTPGALAWASGRTELLLMEVG